MISEERAERAVMYLRDTADEYGQLCGQVELYTGRNAPLEVMEQVIEEEMKKMES